MEGASHSLTTSEHPEDSRDRCSDRKNPELARQEHQHDDDGRDHPEDLLEDAFAASSVAPDAARRPISRTSSVGSASGA